MYNSSKYSAESENDHPWRPPQLQRYLDDNHTTTTTKKKPVTVSSKLPLPLAVSKSPGTSEAGRTTSKSKPKPPTMASSSKPRPIDAPKTTRPPPAQGRQSILRSQVEVVAAKPTKTVQPETSTGKHGTTVAVEEFKTLDDVKFHNLLRDDLLLNMLYDKENVKTTTKSTTNLDNLRKQFQQQKKNDDEVMDSSAEDRARHSEYASMQSRFNKLGLQEVSDNYFLKSSGAVSTSTAGQRQSDSRKNRSMEESTTTSSLLDSSNGKMVVDLSLDNNDLSNASIQLKLKSLRRQLQELEKNASPDAKPKTVRYQVSDSLETKANRLLEQSGGDDDSSTSSKNVSSDGVLGSTASELSLASSISSTSVNVSDDNQLVHKPDFLKCFDLKAKHQHTTELGVLNDVVIDEPLASTEDILKQWRLRRQIVDMKLPEPVKEPMPEVEAEKPKERLLKVLSPYKSQAPNVAKSSKSVKIIESEKLPLIGQVTDTAIQTSLDFEHRPAANQVFRPIDQPSRSSNLVKRSSQADPFVIAPRRRDYNSAEYESDCVELVSTEEVEEEGQEREPTREKFSRITVTTKPVPPKPGLLSPTFKEPPLKSSQTESSEPKVAAYQPDIPTPASSGASQFTAPKRVDESTGSSLWSNISPVGFQARPTQKQDKDQQQSNPEVADPTKSLLLGSAEEEQNPVQRPAYQPTVMSSIGSSISSITTITAIGAKSSRQTPLPPSNDHEEDADELLQILFKKKQFYEARLRDIDGLLQSAR